MEEGQPPRQSRPAKRSASLPRHSRTTHLDVASLHDNALQWLEYIAAGGYRQHPDVEHLMTVASIAADNLRDDINQPVALQLRDALRQLLVHFDRITDGIAITLAVESSTDNLDAHRIQACTGAVREAIRNAVKHARATRIDIYVEESTEGTMVTVRDNGNGFDLERTPLGFGIRYSIEERLARVNGSSRISSVIGNGTIVEMLLAHV